MEEDEEGMQEAEAVAEHPSAQPAAVAAEVAGAPAAQVRPVAEARCLSTAGTCPSPQLPVYRSEHRT